MNKERILTELRAYHSNTFPTDTPSKEESLLKEEIEELEDKITGMLLRLVNGKAEFTDSSSTLEAVLGRVNTLPKTTLRGNYRDQFLLRLGQLSTLLTLAKELVFRMRPVRVAKPV